MTRKNATAALVLAALVLAASCASVLGIHEPPDAATGNDSGGGDSGGGSAPGAGDGGHDAADAAAAPDTSALDTGSDVDGSADSSALDASDASTRPDGPFTLLQSTEPGVPKALAIDDTRLYWISSVTATSVGSVQSVLKDGTGAESVATNQPSPLDIAVDGTNVYWSVNQAAPPTVTTPQCLAMYASKDGGAPECATSGAFASLRMAVTGQYIVILSQSPQANTNPTIGFATLGGTYQNVLAEGTPSQALAAATSIVYLGDGEHVDAVNVPALTFPPNACNGACGADPAVDIAVDVTGDNLFWITGTGDDGVYTTPLPPNRATGTQMATLAETPARMTRDLYYVYATTTHSVVAVPIAAEDAGLAVITLASGELDPFGIAVDDSYVYWTDATGAIRAHAVPAPP